jgi:endonuclease-3
MYGHPKRRASRRSVLDGLVATILSQNTTNANSSRVFDSLKQRFANWDDARTAPTRSIEAAIRSGGLAKTKAVRIKKILQTIYTNRAETSLEHLRALADDDVWRELSLLPGVGPKTVSCVRLFALGRDDFPVDTHVHRVSRRLGWVGPRATREQTYAELHTRVPTHLRHSLHVLMVRHGKETCRPANPECTRCTAAPHCEHASAAISE